MGHSRWTRTADAAASESVCAGCGAPLTSAAVVLHYCAECFRSGLPDAIERARRVHAEVRTKFDLPASPPRSQGGAECALCANECSISPGEVGYCGLTQNLNGKTVRLGGTPALGVLEYYHDPLPTNCVADWVCPAGSSSGYPDYSYAPGKEYGYNNLAVFYGACSFNCLFCQNWHFREVLRNTSPLAAEQLAGKVGEKTACICYFGGDPTPQLPHAIETSRLAFEAAKGRILRVCWETNGSMNRVLLEQMAELSMRSGGCIKFDLKAWNDNVHAALTGTSNRRTLDNFARLAAMTRSRPDPPFLIASTLLVPGYVDRQEVTKMAEFIASLDPAIPYSLLAFHPHFRMRDLPFTTKEEAVACTEAAKEAGLTRVRIGNVGLLR